MLRTRDFRQVDVFTALPALGNPVAVVFDADDLTEDRMAAFARWTNLSETTFVQSPTDERADYRLRIFTPTGELPFAGHPTLGSAHAWLRRVGVSTSGSVIQECGIGLVEIAPTPEGLAFAAPPLLRSGPPDEQTLRQAARGLGIAETEIVAANWVVNGPQWLGVMLSSGAEVLALRPDFGALGDLEVGVIAPWADEEAQARGADYEVRAFAPGLGVGEDPVTGSLNAGLAVWLCGSRRAPASYVAAQGTALGRAGRVQIRTDTTTGAVWVGGSSVTVVSGTVDL
ncbi:PhzF family phenazine biosynthesis protein [Gordonia sp. HY002]|uniref:PhzF family phenazine biosynthesis protein n=1 Tax=Gordonia zhenghanii TaxID=2911516 RepID=UPI001EF0B7B9|nr:PhzF family phenazine biosynthesis protein [Gordonia zhenghanii]MCF8570311.1 PhzF family phenazine biosynthesis protein [Gordonia zhenghanii]MCF8605927.1 PhzF family phenazine biosynthesis protein [Gordonia zhenghanii]